MAICSASRLAVKNFVIYIFFGRWFCRAYDKKSCTKKECRSYSLRQTYKINKCMTEPMTKKLPEKLCRLLCQPYFPAFGKRRNNILSTDLQKRCPTVKVTFLPLKGKIAYVLCSPS